MKTDLFQSCDHCWVFQICWNIEYSTFTASSFRIWNSSTGIPSPPLALLVVMLPKTHLTSYSRMSSSQWVTTPSWLSGSLRPFLYSSSVYSYHLFLISSASVRSLLFLSFIMPNLACNFSLLFFGTLHSNGYIFPFSFAFKLPFFSQLFVRPPQITSLPSCISFSWGWLWSPLLVQCYEPLSMRILQARILEWIAMPSCRSDTVP